MKHKFNIEFMIPNNMDISIVSDWVYSKLYEDLANSQYSGIKINGPFGSTTYGQRLTGTIEVQINEQLSNEKLLELLGNPPDGITKIKIEKL